MNLKVMYVPFPADAVLIAGAGNIITAHNSAHKVDRFRDEVVVPNGGALKNVMRFQQLYIVAHGAHGSDSIFDDSNAALTVAALAQQLNDEKLTSAIFKVKLYCCEGGAGGINSTASQLKDAMRTAGFTNVSVYGYTLSLDQGRLVDGHKEAYADMDAAGVGAKSIRVKY